MSKTVISVEGVSKRYRLGSVGYGSMKEDLAAWWNLVRGKDDPHSKIGETSRLTQSGEFWALKDVNLQVSHGDRLGIIGRNGAGKSTLLKLLSRVTSPTEGRIRVRGRIASLLEVGTGFHGELSGRENIYLNGAILGMKRREIQQNFDKIVEFSEVGDFIDTPVKRYSSGMYVRLAFAVATHLTSDILIIDEVLAVGDAAFQEKSILKMEQLTRDEGKTILFVSHQTPFLRRLCSTGLFLNEGRSTFSGPIDQALELYQPPQTGGGSGGRWVKGGNKLPFAEVFEPLEFYLSDASGQPTTEINDEDDTFLVVKVRVHRPDPRLGLALRFQDDHGAMIFASELYDSMPAEEVARLNGELTFRVRFLKDLYLDKTYSVELVAYLHYAGWVLPPENETRLYFTFQQKKGNQWRRGDSRHGSFVMPAQWNIVE